MNDTRTCSVPECDRKHHSHGYCMMHAERKRRLGDPLAPVYKSMSREDRFRSHYVVNEDNGCFEWIRALNKGYGTFRLSRGEGSAAAHRWAYEHAVGPIPEGLTIDHLCRNPKCVNPAHLEPVTQSENSRRARRAKTHCKHGHEFSEANTYLDSQNGYPKRVCRRCSADRAIAKYWATKAEAEGAA